MTWYVVAINKSMTGCELPLEKPPVVGQKRQLGAIYGRVDDVIMDAAGAPLIVATRLPHPT